MTRLLGLRRIVHTKEDWFYICMYDIDRPITQAEKDGIDYLCNREHVSYILYSTKHGTHFVGLTPLDSMQYAIMFTNLKSMFHSYYSGDTIRLSLKEGEVQVLLVMNDQYGEVIPNLRNLWAKRFNYPKLPWNKVTGKYLLVFEKYRSMNQ